MTGYLYGIEPARKRGQALPPPRPVNRSGMSLLEVLVACGILVVGFIYEWKKGALEWD